MTDARTHIQIVGIIHIIWNVLGVIGGILLAVVAFGGITLFGMGAAGGSGDAAGGGIAIGATFGVISCLVLVLSLPGFAAGIGVLYGKTWARWVLVVVGALNLPGFPIGTALGAYTLWALLNGAAEDHFRGLHGSGELY